MAYHNPVITVVSWTRDRRVRRLLNSFRTRPAPLVAIHPWDQVGRRETTYTGFRVVCLNVLRREILDPLFLAAEAAGDTATVARILRQPTVEQAIDRLQPLVVAPNAFTTVYVAESGLQVAA